MYCVLYYCTYVLCIVLLYLSIVLYVYCIYHIAEYK